MKTIHDGRVIELSEAKILSMAGKINAGRRRTKRGAPKRTFLCVACGQESLGMRAHTAHVFKCPKVAELVPVTPEDLEEWAPGE